MTAAQYQAIWKQIQREHKPDRQSNARNRCGCCGVEIWTGLRVCRACRTRKQVAA